jgi:hypothetical protein
MRANIKRSCFNNLLFIFEAAQAKITPVAKHSSTLVRRVAVVYSKLSHWLHHTTDVAAVFSLGALLIILCQGHAVVSLELKIFSSTRYLASMLQVGLTSAFFIHLWISRSPNLRPSTLNETIVRMVPGLACTLVTAKSSRFQRISFELGMAPGTGILNWVISFVHSHVDTLLEPLIIVKAKL